MTPKAKKAAVLGVEKQPAFYDAYDAGVRVTCTVCPMSVGVRHGKRLKHVLGNAGGRGSPYPTRADGFCAGSEW